MRERLERDYFLFQMFSLANVLNVPLSVIRRMSLEEFYGWFEFKRMERESMKEQA